MTGRLQSGDEAPDFTLPADDGSTVRLSDLRGGKVIVYFYPAAMTPGCSTQACDFTAAIGSLRTHGYAVVGISPDAPERLAAFRQRDKLAITLLADPDKTVLKAWGAYGEKKLYGKVVEGVIRSTFVVDEDGRIERAYYSVKATGHVDRLRRALDIA